MKGDKVLGILRNLLNGRSLSLESKIDMFNGTVALPMLCECKAWAFDKNVKNRVNVLEIICLRTIYGVRRAD